MVEQSTNNILENVYKFNAKELDQSTGYYYYGARYYDPGASVFLSVDPLAEKYPGINPYVYVVNNPINAVDPDGRDFRMITQRNSSGKIISASLHTTVYLQGSGASQELANTLNTEFANRIGSRTINGVKVSINATYVYDNSRDTDKRGAGNNILNVRNDMGDKSSHVSSRQSGNVPIIGSYGELNNIKDNVVNAGIHETLHFLGLSDRYDDFEGFNLNLGPQKQPHSGFRNDIMGNAASLILQDVHFENILNFANEKGSSDKSNSNGFQYFNINDNYIDRTHFSTLKNGKNKETFYHEHSKQARN